MSAREFSLEVDWAIFAGRKADEKRARRYLERLREGMHWRELAGRQMRHDRDVISIPVGRAYRITCDRDVTWVRVQTHEAYNGAKPR